MASKIKVDELETTSGSGSIAINNTLSSFTSTGIDDNATSTAITIDSNENVGIGVTPTTYYSGYTGMQIGTNGTLYGQTAAGASNNFWVGQNVRAGTDGSEKAITTGVSSQMMQSGGAVVFKTGASASADANVTWTTTLDLKADGRGLSQFTAKAWVNFNGQVAAASMIRDSHNISSIVDNGTGNYTLNFANNMANTDYCIQSHDYSWGRGWSDTQTTSSYKVKRMDNGSTLIDVAIIWSLVFGD